MDPTPPHALTPHAQFLHLVGMLNALEVKFADTSQRWEPREVGRLLETPFAELLQQASGTQELSREVLQLTAELAATPHGTATQGRGALEHLATASTMSSYAATHFAEAAESALGLPATSTPQDRRDAENRIISHHSTARAYLRLTSRCLRDAITDLDPRLDAHGYTHTPVPPAVTPAPGPTR
ncbi:hypothetical protein [Streptomyces sp. NPDC059533]|uniref:hypothetical protein n=1 Tax=unclassified Streptomyces TaxID=2593676 RepID=UPI0036BF4911